MKIATHISLLFTSPIQRQAYKALIELRDLFETEDYIIDPDVITKTRIMSILHDEKGGVFTKLKTLFL